jgi:hypothetical protein
MSELIEAIRAAVAQGASVDQKAIGAQARSAPNQASRSCCPVRPKPHPLSGITVDQALDLVIARLTMIANARDAATAPPATPSPSAKDRRSRRSPSGGSRRSCSCPIFGEGSPGERLAASVHRADPARAPTFGAAPRSEFRFCTAEALRR